MVGCNDLYRALEPILVYHDQDICIREFSQFLNHKSAIIESVRFLLSMIFYRYSYQKMQTVIVQVLIFGSLVTGQFIIGNEFLPAPSYIHFTASRSL